MNFNSRNASVDALIIRATKCWFNENNYDDFAEVYDAAMGEDTSKVIFDLHKPYLKSKKESFKLLDLACGTGKYVGAVRKEFPKSTLDGIELSESQARQIRFPNMGNFDCGPVEGNILMAAFGVGYDVITMNLDALNHINDISGWETVFNKAYDALSVGGNLLFDVNTPKRLKEDWNNPEVIISPKCTYVQVSSELKEKNNLVWRSLYMEAYTKEIMAPGKSGRVLVTQMAAPSETIGKMLSSSGFTFKKYELNEPEKHIFFKNREFYVCEKV